MITIKKKNLPKPSVVIVSKEEAYWTQIVESGESEVKTAEDSLKLKTSVLKMAKEYLKVSRNA